jgi:hypothetical protein
VQCALEPVRDRYDLPPAAALHEREDELLDALRPADEEWLTGLFGHDASSPYSPLLYRRGFVHQVRLPAPAWVEHGAAFRERCPLMRSLRVHRLNGWGERLARCESLAGLAELDMACWFSAEDELVLSRSPHLAAMVRLTVWCDADSTPMMNGAYRLANLRELRVVDLTAGCGPSRGLAAILSVYHNHRFRVVIEDRSDWLFSFAADFSPNHYVGQLGDGRQFFGFVNDYYPEAGLRGLTFAPDGTPGDRLDLPPSADPGRVLRERHGFELSGIRVKAFRLDGLAEGDGFSVPRWWPGEECDGFGEPDDPTWPPQQHPEVTFHGNGAEAALRWDGREFTYHWGDWWCDKSGQCHST